MLSLLNELTSAVALLAQERGEVAVVDARGGG
jgi:hypothetical protein